MTTAKAQHPPQPGWHLNRWTGQCQGCWREGVAVQKRIDQHLRLLCDRCAAKPPKRASAKSAADPITTNVGGTSDVSDCPSPPPLPPPCNNEDEGGPWMRRLLADHAAGLIEPAEVELGSMPPDATPAMRAIAKDMKLRMGLRKAHDEDRPLPYALSEAVKDGIARYPEQVSRALDKLVNAKVITFEGVLPRRPGRRYGTRLYGAPPCPIEQLNDVAIEAVDVQPVAEVEDQPVVDRTELRSRNDAVRMVTPGYGASVGIRGGGSHDQNHTSPYGELQHQLGDSR
jgi:hypothetical protein